jgi:hypothetical protein
MGAAVSPADDVVGDKVIERAAVLASVVVAVDDKFAECAVRWDAAFQTATNRGNDP